MWKRIVQPTPIKLNICLGIPILLISQKKNDIISSIAVRLLNGRPERYKRRTDNIVHLIWDQKVSPTPPLYVSSGCDSKANRPALVESFVPTYVHTYRSTHNPDILLGGASSTER